MRRSTIRKNASAVMCVAALAALPLLGGATVASADDATSTTNTQSAANGSYLVGTEQVSDRRVNLTVYSASMGRNIVLQVQRPADASVPRPVLYLLNGAGGGQDSASWSRKTDAEQFFMDKNVNVVTPIGGMLSYYTDWEKDDPKLGRHKWTTFLTQEAPPLVNSALGTNGVNAIAALSMTATSVLNLAIEAPGLFKAVAAYSGCAQTSDPIGQSFVRLVVEDRGGADATNMWGPYGGPGWVANDPLVNAEGLRGTALYISNGSGLPGQHERLDHPVVNGSVPVLANQIVVGGAIEAATNLCTVNLAARLAQLNIPATFNFRPVGTHSWGYWQDDLHQSWPTIAAAIGL